MEAALTALIKLAAPAIAVERTMSILFGWSLYEKLLGGYKYIKTPINFLAAYFCVLAVDFDLMLAVFEKGNEFTQLLTAGLVAGGASGIAKSIGDLKNIG